MTSPVEREQHLRQVHPLGAREAGGRLVEHHQLRLARQRHADLELALLPVREVADGRRELLLEPDARRDGPRCVSELCVTR